MLSDIMSLPTVSQSVRSLALLAYMYVIRNLSMFFLSESLCVLAEYALALEYSFVGFVSPVLIVVGVDSM